MNPYTESKKLLLKNLPYPPSYRYMRHLPYTPDKGDFVICVVGGRKAGRGEGVQRLIPGIIQHFSIYAVLVI